MQARYADGKDIWTGLPLEGEELVEWHRLRREAANRRLLREAKNKALGKG